MASDTLAFSFKVPDKAVGHERLWTGSNENGGKRSAEIDGEVDRDVETVMLFDLRRLSRAGECAVAAWGALPGRAAV